MSSTPNLPGTSPVTDDPNQGGDKGTAPSGPGMDKNNPGSPAPSPAVKPKRKEYEATRGRINDAIHVRRGAWNEWIKEGRSAATGLSCGSIGTGRQSAHDNLTQIHDRERPLIEHLVVELGHLELIAHGCLIIFPQLQPISFTHVIRRQLCCT
jgi:hypothetical protein